MKQTTKEKLTKTLKGIQDLPFEDQRSIIDSLPIPIQIGFYEAFLDDEKLIQLMNTWQNMIESEKFCIEGGIPEENIQLAQETALKKFTKMVKFLKKKHRWHKIEPKIHKITEIKK